MASLRDQQAGRDFASFDDDRKEGRYAPGHFRNEARTVVVLTDAEQAALDAAVAQIEAAFGKFDRKTGAYVRPAKAHRVAA